MVRAEDLEEQALAEVDAEFHDYYGPESGWVLWQQENYLAAIARVHGEFGSQGVAA
jgi:hypothetical protein